MSDFNAVSVIFALGLVHVFIYNLLDRYIWDRSDAVVTGVIRGVAVSSEYRRLLLHVSWFMNVGFHVGIQCIAIMGYILLGRNASAEEVKMLAYLLAFFSAMGAVSWLAQTPSMYSQLRSALRQAEAD